jgi:hypothetical protein
MPSKLSVWLREAGRLYLRYMAVGVASIPFAAGAAFAKQAGWNERIALPVLLSLGVISASLIWRRLGDWQIRPEVSVSQPEWAELLSIGSSAGLMVHSVSSGTQVTWSDALAPLNAIGSEFVLMALSEQPTQRYPSTSEVFQELLAGTKTPQSAHPLHTASSAETSQAQGRRTSPRPFRVRQQPFAHALQG